MDRRRFLAYSAWLLAGSAVGSCARVSSRYVSPERLVQPHESLLIKNISILDVKNGGLRDERRILIQNGRIIALFHDADPQRVRADRVMDLNGAYVMPGIINAHCHMTLPGGLGFGPGVLMAYKRQLERNAEECVKHGVTTVRDMLSIGDWLHELKQKIARGSVIGPRILCCCAMGVDRGYSDRMTFFRDSKFWKEVNNPEEGREAVRVSMDEGADFFKIFQQPTSVLLPEKQYPVMNTETIRGICREAARHGKVVALHHTTLTGMRKGLTGEVPCFEHLVRDTLVGEAELERLRADGAILVPTASASFGLAHNRRGDPYWGKGSLPELVALRSRIMPEMIREYCEPEFVPSSLKYLKKFSNPDVYEPPYLLPYPNQEHFTSALVVGLENGKRYYRAGVTLGCGNDGGVPFVFPGAMGLEMYLLERAGMLPEDILRMATLNNARLLGLEQEIGSIEKGRLADLAVFSQSPLETTRNTFHPMMVFRAGRLAYQS